MRAEYYSNIIGHWFFVHHKLMGVELSLRGLNEIGMYVCMCIYTHSRGIEIEIEIEKERE